MYELITQPIGVSHYLVVGAIMFVSGVICMATKRNAIGILMGVELVLNGANINFIAFGSQYLRQESLGLDGQFIALFVIVLAAAEAAGVDADILDLRSLLPLDLEAIKRSVNKTGSCMVLHEATRTSGFGAELIAEVQEHCFYALERPIVRVTGWDTPYPHALEWEYFPGLERVTNSIVRMMEA